MQSSIIIIFIKIEKRNKKKPCSGPGLFSQHLSSATCEVAQGVWVQSSRPRKPLLGDRRRTWSADPRPCSDLHPDACAGPQPSRLGTRPVTSGAAGASLHLLSTREVTSRDIPEHPLNTGLRRATGETLGSRGVPPVSQTRRLCAALQTALPNGPLAATSSLGMGAAFPRVARPEQEPGRWHEG